MANIILDFDGTCTDAWAMHSQYSNFYAEEFAKRTGVPVEHVKRITGAKEAMIQMNPEVGWVNNGKVVAPAGADPYVLTDTSYHHALPQLREEFSGPGYNFTDEALDWTDLFHTCSKKCNDTFMPGAKEFLEDMANNHHCVIVTNSDKQKVVDKLDRLGNYSIPVVVNARKYVLGDCPDRVPKSMQVKGLERPIFLNRPHYAKVLNQLRQDIGFTPRTTWVVGDIYELDHSLPDALGYQVVLLETKGTFRHEKQHLERNPAGHVAWSLEEVREIITA